MNSSNAANPYYRYNRNRNRYPVTVTVTLIVTLISGYKHIELGRESEAMADLTGYVPVLHDLRHPAMLKVIEDGSLSNRIEVHLANGGLLGCTQTNRDQKEESSDPDLIRARVTIDPSKGDVPLIFRIEESTETVARRFMKENDIPEKHVGAILAFVAGHQKEAIAHKEEKARKKEKERPSNVKQERKALTKGIVKVTRTCLSQP